MGANQQAKAEPCLAVHAPRGGRSVGGGAIQHIQCPGIAPWSGAGGISGWPVRIFHDWSPLRQSSEVMARTGGRGAQQLGGKHRVIIRVSLLPSSCPNRPTTPHLSACIPATIPVWCVLEEATWDLKLEVMLVLAVSPSACQEQVLPTRELLRRGIDASLAYYPRYREFSLLFAALLAAGAPT